MKEIPLTTDQAAPLMGVSPLTLVKAGATLAKVRAILKVGRRAFYYSSDIEAWLAAQVVVPVPKSRELVTDNQRFRV